MTVPVSFEFFPPKTDVGAEKLLAVHQELQALNPQYFSVTYGAGGSTRDRTLSTIDALNGLGAPIAPHLSCIGDSKLEIAGLLDHYRNQGINRIVALRGDLPSGQYGLGELPYAADLVAFIREHGGDHFHIEVAAYPEVHPEAESFTSDFKNLVKKFRCGADSAITQFFYNADSYFYLIDQLAKEGIAQPVVPGIMPITNASNIIRFADSCGAEIPRFMRRQFAAFGDDVDSVKAFGYEVVLKLCERLLAGGAPSLHFYTMNNVEPVRQLVRGLDLT